MIRSSQRRSPLPYRTFATAPAQGQVTVSPSREEIRRADPSLSFRVVAPGARGFDLIVATDPALFDPVNAHRRTPKNFRSSRQDFQGEPIETETGFYLLPRAFLRDLVSVDPKPTRLYYVAVAYDDPAARQGRYSVPPEALAAQAPSVAIAADLAAANLSKVLGVAVERLGIVNARGRVMSVSADLELGGLPDAIGGLPVERRVHLQTPPDALPGPGFRNPVVSFTPAPRYAPAAGPGGGASYAPKAAARPVATGNGTGGPAPAPAMAPQTAESAATTSGLRSGGFVDEDYAYGYGRPGGRPPASRYRDLDMGTGASGLLYDDGFSDDDAAPDAMTGDPIPPLDPVPPPAAGAADVTAPRQAPNGAAAAVPAAAPGDATAEDALLQMILGEGVSARYEALSLDGGFRGRRGPADPYYQRAHDGLCVGPHQATQDSGELGELLALMQAADPAGFARVFGPEAASLLEITNAEGPSGLDVPGGRGPRVQPVAGFDLWEEPWLDRFRSAARHPPFQAAMRGQILARRLDPVRPMLAALGLDSARGMAMLLVAAILRGTDGAAELVRAAVNPFDTPARLGAALDALQYSDLSTFRTTQGLPPGDVVDGPTHIALVAALRALGSDSPVQVPDAEAIMDALVTSAGPGPLGDALLKLRMSPTFAAPATGA